MDLEDRLRTHLRRSTADVGLDIAHPGAPAERHRRRRNRHRGLGTAVALVAVLGVTVATVGRGGNPSETVAVGQTGSADESGSTAAAPAGADSLEWRVAEGEVSGLDGVTRTHQIDGLFYAVSTSPGVTYDSHPGGAYPRSIYSSADGASWDEVTQLADPWISDLGGGPGELLYAVGTAPAVDGAATSLGVYGTSTDGGATWTQQPLPTTAAAPDPDVPVAYSSTDPRMASTGDTALISLTTSHAVDWAALVPDDRLPTDGGELLAEPTPEGLALLSTADFHEVDEGCESLVPDASASEGDAVGDPAANDGDGDGIVEPAAESGIFADGRACSGWPEPYAVIPWSDLPVDGPDGLRTSELFVAESGAAPVAVEWPFADGRIDELAATADGFAATTWTPGDSEDSIGQVGLWTSTDGRSWTPSSPPLASLSAVGSLDGRMVAVGSDAHGFGAAVAVSSDAGATWVTHDLTALIDADPAASWIFTVAISEGGAVVVVDSPLGDEDRGATIFHSRDGANWSATPLGDTGLPTDAVSWVSGAYVADEGTAYVTVSSNQLGESWVLVGT